MFRFELLPIEELRVNVTYVTTTGCLFYCQHRLISRSTPYFSGEVVLPAATWSQAVYTQDGKFVEHGHTELNLMGELKITPLTPLELQLAKIKSRSREEVYQELYERSSMNTSRGFEFLRDKEAMSALLSKAAEERKTFKQSLEDK